jgi:hypothetical protein
MTGLWPCSTCIDSSSIRLAEVDRIILPGISTQQYATVMGSSPESDFASSVCRLLSLGSSSNELTHHQPHSEDQRRPCTCNICGARLSRPAHLQRHLQRHSAYVQSGFFAAPVPDNIRLAEARPRATTVRHATGHSREKTSSSGTSEASTIHVETPVPAAVPNLASGV